MFGHSSYGLVKMKGLYALPGQKKTVSCFFSQSVLVYAVGGEGRFRVSFGK